MSDEGSDRQWEVFLRIHSGLPREGPGSRESTRRALSLIPDLPPAPDILDIGCGPGAQTLDLAELTRGRVHAADNHAPYIERLAAAACARGLSGRVFPRVADMGSLPYDAGSFDLIWAEGSIYIIGVETGLARWRPLLRRDGWIAFTEITWLRADPPDEPAEFWRREYPGMGTVDRNETVIRGAGYEPSHHFVLPESDWWESYYGPLEGRVASLADVYRGDEEALAVLETDRCEIDLYRRYSSWYGYVFYIARRSDGPPPGNR